MAVRAALQSPSCKASYVKKQKDKTAALHLQENREYYIPQQHISVGDFKENNSAQS